MNSDNTNLLEETLGILKKHYREPADVCWVGSTEVCFDWHSFAKVAAQTNYYAGFGGPEVCTDLMVVGNDWWLERHEYDGSEWWEYKELPEMPKRIISPTRLAADMPGTLAYENENTVLAETKPL